MGEVDEIFIAKGKKTLHFEMKENPDEEEYIPLMLGRTGNLRAPTLRRGKSLVVGFNEALYNDFFGL